jgi:hypothetical protein
MKGAERRFFERQGASFKLQASSFKQERCAVPLMNLAEHIVLWERIYSRWVR